MRSLLFINCIAVCALAACASNPDKMQADYISPAEYEDHTCNQISKDHREVVRRYDAVYKQLKKENRADKWQMGVGLAVAWPALLFVEGGDGPEAMQYTELKGRRIALEQAADDKKCGVLHQANR